MSPHERAGRCGPDTDAVTAAQHRLAVDGGVAVRSRPYPRWPPPASTEQERLVLEVLRSGSWGATQGRLVEQLAARLAGVHGARHGLCLANGTLALAVGLRALGVRPGDEVIVPAYTFIATATAAILMGAIPVFADIDPATLLIDPGSVESLVTSRTRAIVPVHLAGCPADMSRLVDLGRRHGIPILEDAAQAHAARCDGRAVGAIGDLGAFSFQTSKNLSAGEGGALVTNDEELFVRAWSLHNVGRVPGGEWYQHEGVGWNLRLTEFQAAVLLPQLDLLPELIQRRERAAAYLARRIAAEVEGAVPASRPPWATTHAWHLFVLRYDASAFGGRSRDDTVRALAAEGIPCDEGYISLDAIPALAAEIASQGTTRTPPAPCPASRAAADGAVMWIRQQVLLGDDDDLEDVVRALVKIQRGGGVT